MDFKEKDAVVYIPLHIAKTKKLPEQIPELLRSNKEVQSGIVTEVNAPSQIVFVLFNGDYNPTACYPRDLHHDPKDKAETPTPTPTPTAAKPGETASAQSAAATTAGAGSATNQP